MLKSLVVFSLAAPFLPSQTLVPVPQETATAEVAFLEAEEAFLHADPTLERDLHKVSPAEAHRRINRAAELANDAMEKRQVYLDVLISRTKQLRNRLSELETGQLPAEKLRSDLEQDQSRILSEQDSVEALIRDFPGEDNVLVRHHLEEERSRLVNLQNNIARQIRSLNTLSSSPGALRSLLDKQQADMDAILKDYGEERESVIRRRAGYASMYSEMHRSVDAGGGSVPVRIANAKPAKGAPNKDAGSPPAAAKASQASGMAGVWIYRSQPNAWTGYGEPAAVSLDLRDEGGVLRGSYTARLPVSSGVHDVQLTLEGALVSANTAKLRWQSLRPPAKGELQLKLGADGRLLIERSRSGDSFVPVGSEVLSRK